MNADVSSELFRQGIASYWTLWMEWFLAIALIWECWGAEVTVDAGRMQPQLLSVNHGDSVRWVSQGPTPWTIESYGGEFRIPLASTNNWSGSYSFITIGTNYYRRNRPDFDIDKHFLGARGGIVVVRDRMNQPAVITI